MQFASCECANAIGARIIYVGNQESNNISKWNEIAVQLCCALLPLFHQCTGLDWCLLHARARFESTYSMMNSEGRSCRFLKTLSNQHWQCFELTRGRPIWQCFQFAFWQCFEMIIFPKHCHRLSKHCHRLETLSLTFKTLSTCKWYEYHYRTEQITSPCIHTQTRRTHHDQSTRRERERALMDILAQASNLI